MDTVSTIHIYF